jgi:hypothetical protein
MKSGSWSSWQSAMPLEARVGGEPDDGLTAIVPSSNMRTEITAHDAHGSAGGVRPEPGMRVWWADSQSDDAVSGTIDRAGIDGWWVVKHDRSEIEIEYPPKAFYVSRAACLRAMLKAASEAVDRHAIGLAAAKLRRSEVAARLEAAEAETAG